MSEGEKKAREVADKIKSEVNGDTEKKEVEKKEVESSLAQISANKELAALYNENAELGASNLGGSLPLLKVHAAGKSHSNELSNGEEPNNGWFFYKPTQEQYQEVTCHILSISRGFRAPGIEDEGENKKEVFNQLVGGVITSNDGDIKPFIMYFSGLKLQRLWDFGKAAAKYTKTKPTSIPLFALNVNMTTEAVEHSKSNKYGKAWVVNFEIVKDEFGFPEVITDIGEFNFMKEHVATLEETFESIIANKSTEDDYYEQVPTPTSKDNSSTEDIPF